MTKVKGRNVSCVTQSNASPTSTKASSKWRWLIALAFVAFSGAGSYAILHYFVLTRIPHVMVGTWLVMKVKTTEGAMADQSLKGGTLEFRRDGTMTGTINMEGKKGTINANVEVEEKTLRITTVNPNNGQKVTDVQTIRTLEGDRFVIEDRKGTILMMERLRE